MTPSADKSDPSPTPNPTSTQAPQIEVSHATTSQEQILQQADAVAAAEHDSHRAHDSHRLENEPFPSLEDVPPPPYSAEQYGQVDVNQDGIGTGAKVAPDGRVDIKIDQVNRRLTNLLVRQLTAQQSEKPEPEPEIPEGLGFTAGLPCPPLNVVIQVVGSRGDVQPFVALGQVLKNKYNHRVRLATHPVFRDFVTENGLEFFSIGGDPAELMAFMVKNPGLMPGMEALRSGDIGKRRKGIYEMITGCWRSCIEPGDGTGVAASDEVLDGRRSIDSAISLSDPTAKPFVADCIIANPPSFAHIHVAEKLGIPLHLMFTMPWSPTQAYPHPLANIISSNTETGMANFLSYVLVDLLTWQGIGDVINRFREKTLRLEPMSIIWAPGSLHRLRIPWTYCWSPALIPKPADWGNFIDISGFFFLDLAKNFTPDPELAEFLAAGPPPVYIGFGSIVVDDPNAMTTLIFEAVKLTGQRALVSKGWGGLSAGELGLPENVFMLGNCPHDWLFERVSAVVHHGGAGTTAAGVKAGRPTVVVPFFGDQPFWGNMVNQAGAGPKPIPYKELTAQSLADAIKEALKPESLRKAGELSARIKNESGPDTGADQFHKRLGIENLRCSICPGRAAVWRVRRTKIRLSALAATVLANEGLVDFSDLKLYRPREYEVDTGPPEPMSGGAAAIIGSIGGVTASIADFPSEVLKSFKSASKSSKSPHTSTEGTVTPSLTSGPASTTDLASPGPETVQSPTEIESSNQSLKDGLSISDFEAEKERGRTPALSPQQTGSTTLSPQPTTSTTLSTDSSSKCSRCGSIFHRNRSEAPSARSLTPSGHHKCPSDVARQVTVDSAIGTAKAAGNIVAVGMRSPLDFTMSLAKGFHNLPRLYHDKTVRPNEKVTGFGSGMRAAGKTFAYGFMDGVGGLVTQPYQGFKEEGGAGLVKGIMKGSLGLVVKPGAAIWGLPAYTMQGIYAEIAKNFGKSTANYIIAARMSQGYEDFRNSGEGEREKIIAAWKNGDDVMEYHSKKPHKQKKPSKSAGKDSTSASASAPYDRLVDKNGELLKGWQNTKHLSFHERKELARRKKELKIRQDEAALRSPSTASGMSSMSDAEMEQAIKRAVQETSKNNPEEDEAIESAIRASVRELQRSTTADREGAVVDDADEASAYQRAVAASVSEYKRSRGKTLTGQETGVASSSDVQGENSEDEELSRALMQSLREHEQARDAAHHHHNPYDSGHDTESDEDYKLALQESLKSQQASTNTAFSAAGITSQSQSHPPPYPISSPQAPSLPPRGTGTDATTGRDNDNNDDENDAEYQEALRLSKEESTHKQAEVERQRTEEDIVLEYVKRQSLAEEEHRRRKMMTKTDDNNDGDQKAQQG